MAFTLSGDAATTRTNLGLGDAATKTTGTAAGNIPVLDSSGQIADAQLAALSVSKLSGVGTTGQVLTSTGTTTAPTMQDAAGSGKVLGVYYAKKTSALTTSSGYTVTDAQITITPQSSTSKFLVTGAITAGSQSGQRFGIWLQESTAGTLYEADTQGSRTAASTMGNTSSDYSVGNYTMQFLHAPGNTIERTYKMYIDCEATSPVAVNRHYSDADGAGFFRGCTTLTVIELDGA